MRLGIDIRVTSASCRCGICGQKIESECPDRGDARRKNDRQFLWHLLKRHKIEMLRRIIDGFMQRPYTGRTHWLDKLLIGAAALCITVLLVAVACLYGR